MPNSTDNPVVESGDEAITLNRQRAIAAVRSSAKAYDSNRKKGVALKWAFAEDLFDLRQTYAQGAKETAAFMATATTESGFDPSVITNLVRAVEVREGLTAKQQEAVKDPDNLWPTDSVLPFATLDRTQANRLIAKMAKKGTTNTKEVRKAKAEIAGTKQRNRQTSPEATAKLVIEVREAVEAKLALYPVEAILGGIELRNSFPNGDLSEAVLFIAANPVPVEVEAELAK